jgi:hypothetical protein
MWTPTALASEARAATGNIWRVVEHQFTTSTKKIVDSQDEQDILEAILEESKPPYPPGIDRLDYLLKTPFRYQPPNPVGSRFRRARVDPGVFYGSETIRTALAEMSYYRVRFFAASSGTPFPRTGEQLTAFNVGYQTRAAIDLTLPPLNRDRTLWAAPQDYVATQSLAVAARRAAIDVIRYESVRDVEHGINVALLSPQVFTSDQPTDLQTWQLFLGPVEVSCVISPDRGRERHIFPLESFEV